MMFRVWAKVRTWTDLVPRTILSEISPHLICQEEGRRRNTKRVSSDIGLIDYPK